MAEFKGSGNKKWDGIFEKDALKVKWGMRDGATAALSERYAERDRTTGGAPRSGASGKLSGTAKPAASATLSGSANLGSSAQPAGVSGTLSGASAGSVKSSGPSVYARPVNVKVKHYDKAQSGAKSMARTLLVYMEKDGRLFGREEGVEIDRDAKIQEWGNDRLLWHVMESPNDGHMMTEKEMETLARDTVSRWEERLGPVEWVAVVEEKPDAAHPDGNKHLHIAIRGVQDGRDLWIDRSLMTEGHLRADAMEAVTDRLGYMSEREVVAYQRQLEEGRERRGERDIEMDRTNVERAMDEEMERYMTLDRNDELWEQP